MDVLFFVLLWAIYATFEVVRLCLALRKRDQHLTIAREWFCSRR